MGTKSLAPVLFTPMLAMGYTPSPADANDSIIPMGLEWAEDASTQGTASSGGFGDGWIYVFFPGFGTFSLGGVTTEGTFAWDILQAFGGSLEGFEYIHLKTYSPTAENGGVMMFMPVHFGCVGDFNSDGEIDLFDVFTFFDAFEAQETSADLNSDGQVEFFDLILFLDAYSTGC